MNTPNPLIPQGTFPDNRGRSQIRIAVFTILAVHIVLLGSLLMAGCKKTAETAGTEATNTYSSVQLPTNTLPSDNLAAQPPNALTSNLAPPTSSTIVPPPQPLEAEKEHVVLKGESFYTIAKKYGVTGKAITDANPGVDSTKLKIGQKLKIPAASTALATATPHSASNGSSIGAEKSYTVKSGDNLLKIAKAHSVTVQALRSANALKTDQIKVGQKLKIPAKAATPEPASAGIIPVSSPTVTATNPSP